MIWPSGAVGDGSDAGVDGRLHTVAGAPTIWFTGLSGAGKTTIAQALARQLDQRGLAHTILDGDELRATLSAGLGFSRDDRAEQVRRVGHLARILGDAGVIPLVTLVSPFRADRDAVRALHAPARFLEVHVATALDVCARRDVKGLYAQAQDGRLEQFTGVSQDYERPEKAELTLDGDDAADIEELAGRVLGALQTVLTRHGD